MNYEELEWEDIVTPIQVNRLEHLLVESKYDVKKSKLLVDGFKYGFDLGYRGPENRQDEANNLPFRVGTPTDLWNKVMKEVKEHRFAGPFERPPTQFYVQSPLGLVPKSGGKTRLIFHLSYNFGTEEHKKSINFFTPEKFCKVKYNDLDTAVQYSLQLMSVDNAATIFYAKTDCSHAFRILPMKIGHCKFLTMKVRHPVTKVWWYFMDKCLPFGSSISCAHFQSFSDALKHIAEWKIGMSLFMVIPPRLTNYLDDFLFMALTRLACNGMISQFLELCKGIGCPISMDKTEWVTTLIVFLGILLNGKQFTLSIPMEKRIKAINLIQQAIDKKKVTIHFIQKLTGTLNFLNRAIVPGRAFTKGMYKNLSLRNSKGELLKKFHHVHLNREFIQDCKVWLRFLLDAENTKLCRPFVDFSSKAVGKALFFYSDASRNPELGMGAIFNNRWLFSQWPEGFVNRYNPSIEYLELYALTIALLTWRRDQDLSNARIIIFCDNESVVHMVNGLGSSCSQCMKLIRIIALESIIWNCKVVVRHVRSEANSLADSLSRLKLDKFWADAHPATNREPDDFTHLTCVWSMDRFWNNKDKYLPSF